MSFYPPKISERVYGPKNSGTLADANATGVHASFICGSSVNFSLQIEMQTKQIVAAKFVTNGCGYMIAAADLLAEMITGKKLVELHGLHDDVIRGWINAELERFPATRQDCMDVCIAALHSTLTFFRAKQLDEWRGEKVLICTCFGVAEDTIENAIRAQHLTTVDEVTEACNAGGGCGSCQPLIQDILDSHRREML